MKPIPETENPLVLRTDFSNEAVWGNICALIQKPVGLFGFRASMEALRELADRLIAAGIDTKGVEQFVHTDNWYGISRSG
jgi:hypothetical protein